MNDTVANSKTIFRAETAMIAIECAQYSVIEGAELEPYTDAIHALQ